MTPETWLRSLAAELSDMPPSTREMILQDAREAVSELGAEALGAPVNYAVNARTALTPESGTDGPQAQIGPVTVDFRGLTNSTVRSRIWDPTNPHIITSKVFGIGWDINLGAIAVKLGLIRPDDYDEETVRAIPATIRRVSTAYPIALSAFAVIDLLLGARRESSRLAAVGNALVAVIPTMWSRRATPQTEDALVRNAIASGAATIAVGTTLQRSNRKTSGLTTVCAGTALFLQLLLPVRAGLKHLWRQKEHDDE